MRLTRVEIVPGSAGADRVRLVGHVRYRDDAIEDYWLEVPAVAATCLSTSGDPWLAWLLPLAAVRGEPLHLDRPVDPALRAAATEIVRVWQSWYGGIAPVALHAPEGPARSAAPGGRIGAFLSGGVDSWFTVLRPRADEAPDTQGRVDEALTIGGFDIGLDRADAFARLARRLEDAAGRVGVSSLALTTNLRGTRWGAVDWGRLGHGAALAGVALALSPRFRTVYVPATGGYRDLHPWGSHPVTDPLWSTGGTRLVHDGAAFTRVDKTRLLATVPAALEALHVCWRSGTDENCGACNKCYRAMLVLELLGALERCPAFPSRRVDPARAARIFCAESWDYRELRDIRRLADEVGRDDIARAVERAMRRSGALSRWVARARALRDLPVLWRWAGTLEQRLLAGWLR